MAMASHLQSKHGLVTGYDQDTEWDLIAGKDSFHFTGVSDMAFDALYKSVPEQIIHRVCASCQPSHQHIYYKRYTELPQGFSLLNTLLNSFTNENNQMNTDFKLYSTLEDARADTNAWTFCNYNQWRGMPNECGPTARTTNQHARFNNPYGRENVAFYMMKGATMTLVEKGGDINSP